MYRPLYLRICLFIGVFGYMLVPIAAQKLYVSAFSDLDSCANKLLPQQGLTLADSLLTVIEADSKNPFQQQLYLKAFIYKNAFLKQREEDGIVATIQRFEAEALQMEPDMKAITYSLLAELYDDYSRSYSRSRYNLTEIVGDASTDIRVWSGEELTARAATLYKLSLQDSAVLNRSLTNYWLLLEKKPNIEKMKTELPSLYDLLFERARQYFSNSSYIRTGLAEAILLPIDRFLEYPFKEEPSAGLAVLYQNLLRFHQKYGTVETLNNADIKRIAVLFAELEYESASSSYFSALDRYALTQQAGWDKATLLKAEQLYKLGEKYIAQDSSRLANRWQKKEAYQLLLPLIDKTTDKLVLAKSQNLLNSICYSAFDLSLEEMLWPGQKNLVKLEYKNIDSLYYKIIALNAANHSVPSLTPKDYYKQQQETWDFYNKQPAIAQNMLKLPNEGDFQEHSVEFMLDSLPVGKYVLLCSKSPNFVKDSNCTVFTYLQATNLAALRYTENDYYVVNRKTGMPLKEVEVSFWKVDRVYDNICQCYPTQFKHRAVSDAFGKVTLEGIDLGYYKSYKYSFKLGDDSLELSEDLYANYKYKEKTAYTYFMTDRSMYRPGQTVYFKGIAIEENGDESSLKKNYKMTVSLYNVNGEELADTLVTTNQYGSFSGSFKIPPTGLTGKMRIGSKDERGQADFRVEEYKIPKFEVKMLPTKASFALGDSAFFEGEAVAYNGSAISFAKISYEIRSLENDFQYAIRGILMTKGEAVADAFGKFKIPFLALVADMDTTKVYRFDIKVDVTDNSGETRSAHASIKIGQADLQIYFSESSRQELKFLKLAISTSNLNNEPSAAVVNYKVEQLEPLVYGIEKRWKAPDYSFISKEELQRYFSYYTTENKSGAKVIKIVEEGTVNVDGYDTAIPIKNKKDWAQGTYRIRFSSKDNFGNKVESSQLLQIVDYSKKEAYTKEALEVEVVYPEGRSFAEPGETVYLCIETAEPNGIHLLYLEQRTYKNSEPKWIFVKNRLLLPIKITEEDRGGFGYNFRTILNHRNAEATVEISVPWTNKRLKFEYLSFRDKVAPGAMEEWKIKISDSKGPAKAELLASMYDMSLNAYTSHNWDYFHYKRYSSYTVRGIESLCKFSRPNIYSTSLSLGGAYYYPSSLFTFSNLNWFILSDSENGYRYNRYTRHDAVYFSDTLYLGFTEVPMQEGQLLGSSDIVQLATRDISDIRATTAGISQYDEGENFSSSGSRSQRSDTYVDGARVVGSASFSDLRYEGFYKSSPNAAATQKKTTDISDFSDIQIRKNLSETVFFYPHLQTNKKGNVFLKFRMNESLTRWKLQLLAHSKDMKFGYNERELVTQKDLMVIPNPPRFLREGDSLYFPAKVANLSDKALKGEIVLQLLDAVTEMPIDAAFGNAKALQTFNAESKTSVILFWKLSIPKNWDKPVLYRVIAKSGQYSDGEQNILPLLTNRILVTESMPLLIRAGETKTTTLESMKNAGKSTTLLPHKYSLEFTQNPAWYALQSLPYLMEFPHECSEQLFSRYFANALASQVLNSHPKIKVVFEQWDKNDGAGFSSKLATNKNLKSAILEETPWVLEAGNERERKKNLALLFDLAKMSTEQDNILKMLAERQAADGGFPWFPGGRSSWHITEHILVKLLHLNKLGVHFNNQTLGIYNKALDYCNKALETGYQDLLYTASQAKDGTAFMAANHLDYMVLHYLYARSFMPDSLLLDEALKKIIAYYRQQAEQYWTSQPLLMQGKIALILYRADPQNKTAALIVQSLKERAISTADLGMYWKINSGYFWYEAPIETQALLIEVFDEVAKDRHSVEEMKIWLLSNKRTQNWPSTMATTAACYALLMTGDNWLSEEKESTITLGTKLLDQSKVEKEAGTGYFKMEWSAKEIKPEMATLKVENPNKNAAWAAVYWQYFEDADKVKQFKETPLKIDKKLFKQISTAEGPKLLAIADSELAVGDLIKVRIEIRSDRDMEYVHIKDQRASGFEPVNVLSQYKYQGGIGYYESTRDAATNFFIDYLRKGTYVFEYELRVNHKGGFSNGITTIQCMYAPEFTSHSEGMRVKVN